VGQESERQDVAGDPSKGLDALAPRWPEWAVRQQSRAMPLLWEDRDLARLRDACADIGMSLAW
jgi:hypothetical protein